MKRIVITGGAGFIGYHLTERLLEKPEITVIDNLSSGKRRNIERFLNHENVRFVECDIVKGEIDEYFEGADIIYHFAANPNVRLNESDVTSSFYNNIYATHRVLEAARKNDVPRLHFASTSAVYGLKNTFPTKEDGSLNPISIYGSTKLACELMIDSYCNYFGMKSTIYRMANVVGERGHGVIPDFIDKLTQSPESLSILGNGNQNKSYVHIDDVIDAIIIASENQAGPVDVFNIGSEDQMDVKSIARIVSGEMGLNPTFQFGTGESGWKGDIPAMLLDIGKMKAMGWNPKHDSRQAVIRTVRDMISGR